MTALLRQLRWIGRRVVRSLLPARYRPLSEVDVQSFSPKAREEMTYWIRKRRAERRLRNDWYVQFFTEHFGLPMDAFTSKSILDIGCGPRGSLEWAGGARLLVGADPLAHRYIGLGTKRHRMHYLAAIGEHLPIADAAFDVVTCFNALDHADDPSQVAREIVRVLSPGGVFLLLVDVNHVPTDSEPSCLPWSVVDEFSPPLDPVLIRRFEKRAGVYQSVLTAETYDEHAGTDRPGVLSAMFRKPSVALSGSS